MQSKPTNMDEAIAVICKANQKPSKIFHDDFMGEQLDTHENRKQKRKNRKTIHNESLVPLTAIDSSAMGQSRNISLNRSTIVVVHSESSAEGDDLCDK